MSRNADEPTGNGLMSRRTLIKGIVAVAGAMAVAPAVMPGVARAQGVTTGNEPPVLPPIVPTGREFGPDAPPTTYFTDPDIITIDPAFNGLIQGNTSIQRLWTGALWMEGPAWNSVGRYLIFSDIPNNRQMRWLEDNGDVTSSGARRTTATATRSTSRGASSPASTSTRRVVRYEHDGTVTILADNYQGKRLNSPNDVVAASRRQHLVHRSAVRRPAVRGHGGRGGRAGNTAGRSTRDSASRRSSARTSASCRPTSTASTRAAARHRRQRRSGARTRTASLLARLQEALRRQHRQRPRRHRPGRRRRRLRLRRRRRQQAVNQRLFTRLHGQRRQVRSRRHPRRRLRQRLDRQQRRPQPRLQRRDGLEPGRQAARPHPDPGGVRQHHVRRPEAEPPVHGGSQSLYAVYTGGAGLHPRASCRQHLPPPLPSPAHAGEGLGVSPWIWHHLAS